MTAKNTIVVGVDGSDASGRAVAWAASTAVSHGYSLRIVTAVDVPTRLTDEQALEFRRVAESRLTASAEIARGVGGGSALDIAGEARDGNVVDVLLDESARCALVVLGASGLNESDSRLLGSASIGLSAHAHSPVAVVRGRSVDTDGAPGPVIVGIDGSAVNQAAIAAGFDEASRRGAPLVAVHVWSDVSLGQISAVPQQWEDIAASEEAVLAEGLAGWQEKYPDVDVRRVVAQDRPVRVLGRMSEEASLIVVGNRGRGGFTGMLLGSTSYALIHTADCPVLVVRGQQN